MNKLAAVLAVVAATGGTALAEPSLMQPSLAPPSLTPPSLTEPVAPMATKTEWYGWQILLADGATFAIAAGTEQGELALGWIGTGAVVHAAHHNYGRSVLSVGLRIGLPLLGASVGAANANCSNSSEDLCGLGETLMGGLIGMGVAEVIDVAMAKDEKEIVPAKPRGGWTPVAKVGHSSATLGIAARF